MAHSRILTIAQPVWGGGKAFAPTDIAGLALWLKADAGLFKDAAKTQPCTADGDAVYTLADQSGNGRDAVQATAGARPTKQTLGGLAVVRLDGIDDFMKTAGAIAPQTVIAAAKFGSATFQYALDFRSGVSTGYIAGAVVGIGVYWTAHYRDGVLKSPVASANVFDATMHVHSFMGTNNAETGIMHLASRVTEDAGTMVAADIREILIYNSVLSDANRASVEAYLNSRWAVY